MFRGNNNTQRSNVSPEDQQRIERALREFSEQISLLCDARGIPKRFVPFGSDHTMNFLVIRTPSGFHLVVNDVTAGGLPLHRYHPQTPFTLPAMSLKDALNIAEQDIAFEKPVGISFPAATLHDDEKVRGAQLNALAADVVGELKKRALRLDVSVPSGYEYIADRFLSTFLNDHPDWRRNVFIMMRFEEKSYFEAIDAAIRRTLELHGFTGLRADDKAYSTDLWENVCVYMLGCSHGVVVFEEIDQREFNPSVSLELGFMLAQNKRCLILKDKRMPKVPTDIVGKLYKVFDAFSIEKTVSAAVSGWVTDLGPIA